MKVQLHPDAEEELYQAALWYENRKAGLGDDLMTEIGHWLDGLAETSLSWPLWLGAPAASPVIRRAVTRRFPFSIAYQAFPDRVWVLAIAHTSREPFYWADRAAGGHREGDIG